MSDHAAVSLVNILTPVLPGRESALSETLATLPYDGLFDRLEAIHFARWVLIGRLPTGYRGAPPRGRQLRMTYLLFSAGFNGTAADLFDAIRQRLGSTVDGVWGECVNYPGHVRRLDFVRYLEHNSLRIHQQFLGYEATVGQVRAATALRKEHIRFAQDAQRLKDDELLAEFRTRFGVQK